MITDQQEIATPDITAKVRSQALKFGTTKWLTYTAAFAALAAIFKYMFGFVVLFDFRLTLIYIIWWIAAAALGPIGGGAVCFVSEFIYALWAGFSPLIICNTLSGVVAGLIFKYTPSKSYTVRFIIVGIVCTIIFTCILNSLTAYYYWGYSDTMTFWEYFVAFRTWQLLIAAINIGVTVAMIPLLDRRLHLLPVINGTKKKGRLQKTEVRP